MDEYDYIIVGAGSAGCVLAERLGADPRNRILVLEAGGSDARFWIKVPLGYAFTSTDARLNWDIRTAPDEGLNGRSQVWPRGRVVGGGRRGHVIKSTNAVYRDHRSARVEFRERSDCPSHAVSASKLLKVQWRKGLG